jgi:hypothetical protein
MSVYSRVYSPAYSTSEDDAPPARPESRVAWSIDSLGDRSISSGRDMDDQTFVDSIPERYGSRRPGPVFSSRPAASRSRHIRTSEVPRPHSVIDIQSDVSSFHQAGSRPHSVIDIQSDAPSLHHTRPSENARPRSSPNGPDATNSELAMLRTEVERLARQIRRLTDRTYVSNLYII